MWRKTNMTSGTIRYLLNKLPKKTLIETIIQTYEARFTDPLTLKQAHRELATIIQAREVYQGRLKLMKLQEPFRTKVQKLCTQWAKEHGIPK